MKQNISLVGLLLTAALAPSVLAQDAVAMVTVTAAGPVVTVLENADGTPYIPASEEAKKPAAPAPVNNVNKPEEKVYVPPSSNPTQGPTNPPTPLPTAVNSPAPAPSGGLTSNGNNICFNFQGGDFHFMNTGSWGSKSGQGAQEASQCFDLQPNGAMFICDGPCDASGDASAAKYTKLECTLGGDWQNCDISLVDGFSLPLECTIPGASPAEKIGGTTDLNTLTSCPAGSVAPDNTCHNSGGYQDASAVSTFFTNANNEGPGGNYCTWQFCSADSDVFFKGTPNIECTVGTIQNSKAKREAEAEAKAAQSLQGRSAHRHGHSHAHARAHAHARGLKDVLSHDQSARQGWMFR